MSDHTTNGKGTEASLPYHESPTPRTTKPALHHTLRTELTAFIGEFIGTFMFLSLAFAGTQIAVNGGSTISADLTSSASPPPDVGKLLYIAFVFGMSLAINVAIFADISGAKFNPAVCACLVLSCQVSARLLLYHLLPASCVTTTPGVARVVQDFC
jgi:aquaporin related protein